MENIEVKEALSLIESELDAVEPAENRADAPETSPENAPEASSADAPADFCEDGKKAPSLTDAEPEAIARAVVEILDEKKAADIRLLKVDDKTVMADYLVICTGHSNTQVKGMAGEVEFKLGERGLLPLRTEGYETGRWIVLDYASVLVHIFHGEDRDFYKLDKLWGDAHEVPADTL